MPAGKARGHQVENSQYVLDMGGRLARRKVTGHSGSLIALIGMILLLVANSNRRAARRRQVWTKTNIVMQKWGTLAAYAMIAVGLLFLLKRR